VLKPAGLIIENPPLTSLSPIWMHICKIRAYEIGAYEMRACEMWVYGDACL
jgi:hypothetical protein